MISFDTYAALSDYIEALPGYVPATLCAVANEVYQDDGAGGNVVSQRHTYAQEITGTPTYVLRTCIVVKDVAADGTIDNWRLSLPVTGGPNEYVPAPFSLCAEIARDLSSVVAQTPATAVADPGPVKLDNGSYVECNPEEATYYRATLTHVFASEFGLENVIACWDKFNRGDFITVSVDAPVPGGGWFQVFAFGQELTIFGDNPYGTPYPTIPATAESGSASWIPAGLRLRLDCYMKVGGAPYGPSDLGWFLDLDVIGKVRR